MTARYISAIDIGTNSFHLLVTKIIDNSFEVVHREREVFRLKGKNNSNDNLITEENIIGAIDILKRFKLKSDDYNAEIIAVATSAMRDAVNKEIICNKILDEVGIDVKILTGDEEAKLVFKAVQYQNKIGNKNILIFDLGGGSTEFIIGKFNELIYKNSVQLGAVGFTQKYFPDYKTSDERIELMISEVKKILSGVKNETKEIAFNACVGIGGTITAISWLIEKNIYSNEHSFSPQLDYKISRKEFEEIKKIVLAKSSLEERKSIAGLELKRADIISAGIIIVDEIFNELGLNEIVASGLSIKEGIVISAIEKSIPHPGV